MKTEMHERSFFKKNSTVLLLVLLLVVSSALWYVLFARHYFMRYGDGLDYAQIAENVYSKQGMVTRVYPLLGLDYLREENLLAKAWPNLHRFPFPVLVTALMYTVLGVNNFSTAFSSGIFYILSVPTFYALSKKVLKSTTNALLVTTILMLSMNILHGSIINTTEMPSIFLFILLTYVMHSSAYEKNYFLAGLILGVFYYNRYNIIIFLPVISLFIAIFTAKNRIRNILYLNIAFLIVTLPWFAYNLSHSNSPFFSLTAKADFAALTDKYPYLHSLWFGLDYVNEWEFLLTYPGQMLKKWITQALAVRRHLPELAGGDLYLFAFFFVGLFVREQDPNIRLLKYLTLLLFLSQLVGVSFYINSGRFYLLFAPVFILLAFHYFLKVVTNLHLSKWMRHSMIIIMVAFFCLPGIKRLVEGFPNESVDYSIGSETQKNLSSLNDLAFPEDVIVSDVVVATGRYVAARSLPLPRDHETITEIQEEYLPIKYILISDYVLSKEIWKEWWPVFEEQQKIDGFTLIERFSDGSLLYMSTDSHENHDRKGSK